MSMPATAVFRPIERANVLARDEAERQAAAADQQAERLVQVLQAADVVLVDDGAPGIGIPLPELWIGAVLVDGEGVVEGLAHHLDDALRHRLVAGIAARPEARQQQGAVLHRRRRIGHRRHRLRRQEGRGARDLALHLVTLRPGSGAPRRGACPEGIASAMPPRRPPRRRLLSPDWSRIACSSRAPIAQPPPQPAISSSSQRRG